nr:MAG TPA: hypothetical protein [Caudoviricetes sp.]
MYDYNTCVNIQLLIINHPHHTNHLYSIFNVQNYYLQYPNDHFRIY